MSSFTLSSPQAFPEGVDVSVYPASNWPNGIIDQGAAPIGSATNTQTVSSGSLTFTGLTDGVKYAAYYNGRYVIFTPGSASSGGGGGASSELLAASGVGVIVHGSTASTDRGTDFAQYIWLGTVEPDNLDTNDIWIDTT